MIKRYKFNTELEADNLTATLSNVTNAGTEDEVTINEFNVLQKVAKEVITDATYDNTGAVLTTEVLSEVQFVDILWKDTENAAFKPFEQLMNGEQSSISGVNFETRNSRLARIIAKGIVITTNGNTFWFNQTYMNDFITQKLNKKDEGKLVMEWKGAAGWITIPMADADYIAAVGNDYFQNVYKTN